MSGIRKRDFLAGTAGAALLAVSRLAKAQPPGMGARPPGGGFGFSNEPFPGGYVIKAPPVPPGEPSFATVREGRLEGVQAGGIRYFRGIPFAQPPVGPLRFKPPRPAMAWPGVRKAIDNPPAPLQVPPVAEAPRTSEDCLYLNIWAPSTPGPHPVYVFIPGGGNVSGYALEHRLQGASFARDGIVCVTVSYRVGAFGFLELSGLLGPAYAGSGNNGLRDQLLALEWVRDNIGVFGGDPRRVTIGGQSAGAINALSLTASPRAKGLFRAAISQSGHGHQVVTMTEAHAVADRFAQALKTAGGKVEDLPSMPADLIVTAERDPLGGSPNFGVIDGDVLLEHPYEAMRKGRGRDVRLLLGSNRDELVVLGGAPDPAGFSPAQKTAFEKYKALHPGVPDSALAGPFGADQTFGAPTRIYADDHAAAGGVGYVYRCDWGPATGKFKGLALHGIETPFVWDYVVSLQARYVALDPSLQIRADALHRLWVSFIVDGRPSAPGVPDWPSWSPNDRRYLEIDDGFEIKTVSPAEMEVWSGLLET